LARGGRGWAAPVVAGLPAVSSPGEREGGCAEVRAYQEVRRLEVSQRRRAFAWRDLLVKNIFEGAEKAEPSETPWHTYDGTPVTA